LFSIFATLKRLPVGSWPVLALRDDFDDLQNLVTFLQAVCEPK
jgi:hypothetical protein